MVVTGDKDISERFHRWCSESLTRVTSEIVP